MALRGPGTLDFMFGDAADGSVTVTGTIALNKDTNFDVLTLSASGPQVPTVYTNSYRLFARRIYAATSATFVNSGSSIVSSEGSLPALAGQTFYSSAQASLSGYNLDYGDFKSFAGFGGNGGVGTNVAVSASQGVSGLPSPLSGGSRGLFNVITGYLFGAGGKIFPMFGGLPGGAGASDTFSTPGFHGAGTGGLPQHDAYLSNRQLIYGFAPNNTNPSWALAGLFPSFSTGPNTLSPFMGIWRTTNKGATWTQMSGGSGGYGAISSSAIVDIANDSRLANFAYAVGYRDGNTGGSGYFRSGSVFKTIDAGTTWTAVQITSSLYTSNHTLNSIVVSPVTSTIYVNISQGANGGYLLRSVDTGSTFTTIFSGTFFPTGLGFDRNENLYSYNASSASYQRSQTKGTVWTTVTGLPAVAANTKPWEFSNIKGIFASTTGNVVISAQSTQGLYKSIDGGNSFARIMGAGGVLGNFLSVASDPLTGSIAYAISLASGVSHVWKTLDAGTTWTNIEPTGTLTGTTVIDTIWQSAYNTRLYVSPVTGSVMWMQFATSLYEKDTNSGPGSTGGNGGGVILVVARDVIASGAITFDVSGAPGSSASFTTTGAGGGGGGGLVILSTASVTGTLRYNLSGGLPGASLAGGVSGTAGTTGSVILYTMA